jgi:EAL domain-containing protein (putative c-di-GMP-specific phosphodiesterase class I)
VSVSDLSAAMDQTIDPMRLMQRVTDRTLELIEAADGVLVGLADGEGVTYVCIAGDRMTHVGTRVGLETSLSGLAVLTRQLQFSDDTRIDSRVDAAACERMAVLSTVCLPLNRGAETLGVLTVSSVKTHSFGEPEIATLMRLADFVSVVIGSACDLSRVNASLGAAIESGRAASEPAALATASTSDAALRYMMSVLSPDTVSRIDSEDRIRQVLGAPEVLSMVFQPIVDLDTCEVAAVESQSRFETTPQRTPDLWFAEAHEHGLGVELEVLAVTRAIAELATIPAEVALTVNAGPEVVLSRELRDAVLAGPASRIIIELTEHTEIDDYPGLIAALCEMRRAGARIAIDDTGSGYSSLAHILKLAPEFIKLDRDLVSGIDVDPVRRALAASLVTFAADTGAQIIAEGVESQAELASLRKLGVRYAQGFHLGHPEAPARMKLSLRHAAATARDAAEECHQQTAVS